MTDTPTLAGLASELADALARIARLESMTAHPEWCVPLTEDEERPDTAEGGPVRPCEPRSAQTANCASQDSRGAQKDAQAPRTIRVMVQMDTDELRDMAAKYADSRPGVAHALFAYADQLENPIEAAHRAAKAAGMVAVKVPDVENPSAATFRARAKRNAARGARGAAELAIADGIEAQQALTERNRA